jgi:hypothetical protein
MWCPLTSKHVSHWHNEFCDMLKFTFHDFVFGFVKPPKHILNFQDFLFQICPEKKLHILYSDLGNIVVIVLH